MVEQQTVRGINNNRVSEGHEDACVRAETHPSQYLCHDRDGQEVGHYAINIQVWIWGTDYAGVKPLSGPHARRRNQLWLITPGANPKKHGR